MITPNKEKIIHLSKQIRQSILKMIYEAGSGHPAGSLGMTDVFTTLYFSEILNFDPKNVDLSDRDIVILSNAHIAPVYYSTLAFAGYFDPSELMLLRKFGSRLQGHPSLHSHEIGIETSGGPLGQGISVAVGYALSSKLDKKDRHIYCFCSDGELDEGQAWEGFMSAAKYKLDNITFIIDRNNIQIDGNSNDIMPLEPLHEKLKAFNLDTIDVNGHDIDKIYDAIKYSKNKNSLPHALIMHTIPGKGVSFMENDYKWHGKAPNEEELNAALKELV